MIENSKMKEALKIIRESGLSSQEQDKLVAVVISKPNLADGILLDHTDGVLRNLEFRSKYHFIIIICYLLNLFHEFSVHYY
jgi:hypothetical protein